MCQFLTYRLTQTGPIAHRGHSNSNPEVWCVKKSYELFLARLAIDFHSWLLEAR